VPGLTTVLMLAVLIGLGTWQIYRMQWKEGILAQIALAEAGPPALMTPHPAPYAKIVVTGHFRFDRVAQFGAEVRDTRAGPTMGFYQIVPLERDSASPILVNRGWVPQKWEMPLDDPNGVATVIGYVRPADMPHWFSPTDDVATRQFFTLDPRKIGSVLGVRDPAPFTLVALGQPMAELYPAPAQHLPQPPNNHLSYAVTWYGLAVALIVIFGVWARKVPPS
jgi:surfeit locus 1 family protein